MTTTAAIDTMSTAELAAANLNRAAEWVLTHPNLPVPAVAVSEYGSTYRWHNAAALTVGTIMAAIPVEWTGHMDDERTLGWIKGHTLDGAKLLVFTVPEVAERYGAARTCGCRTLEHGPLCPRNPDPSICDTCRTAYDPEAVECHQNCPGGHCADEACLCWVGHLHGAQARRE